MRRGTVLLSMILALVLVGRALAHEGHAHNTKLMGTVAAIETGHLEMSTEHGAKVSIVLNKDTKCFKGKAPAKIADIKVGDRVVVTVVEEGDKMIAREVRMAAAPG